MDIPVENTYPEYIISCDRFAFRFWSASLTAVPFFGSVRDEFEVEDEGDADLDDFDREAGSDSHPTL